MRTDVELLAADLTYPPELALHTAASGRIDRLEARYVRITRADGFDGTGEVRVNIPYLTGLSAEAATEAIVALLEAVDWSVPGPDLPEALDRAAGGDTPAIARAAVDSALTDGAARAAGVPVAEHLGGDWAPAVSTNQCLFWGPDSQLDRLASRYVAEGFTALKLRVGIGDFAQDIARLQRLRNRHGAAIRLAVDANGAWSADAVAARLAALAPFDLDYVEQPTPAGDWAAFDVALAHAPMKLMLDESLKTADDLRRLADLGPAALGHLKIAKLGGPRRVVAAARGLAASGVGVMIGQMNEGGLATALAAHCAMATRPAFAELYGCYGLRDDVATGIDYAGGMVRVAPGPGLGAGLQADRCRRLWRRSWP